MKFLSTPVLSGAADCPYLEDFSYRQEYFFGTDADPEQFQILLDHRYRRFGVVFFRPVCPECRKCIPLRIDTSRFLPSSSQKRVLRKNKETKIVFTDLNYRPELYRIYEKHSRVKFNQESAEEEFYRNFFQPGVPSFQSEYYSGDKLIGFGILDIASSGLSTVYFSYDPEYSALSPGTFSILAEIEETRRRGLRYYYSGYYIRECTRMAYKGKFHPYELLIDGIWTGEEDLQKNP